MAGREGGRESRIDKRGPKNDQISSEKVEMNELKWRMTPGEAE